MFSMGLDIGYSNLNVAYGAPAGAGGPVTDVRPVGAAEKERLPIDVLGKGDEFVEVQVDGKLYAACVDPNRLENWSRILYEDYPSTAAYRALFRAGLALTNRNRVDKLVTGLPVRSYLEEGAAEKLARRMRGTHEIREGYQVEVGDVEVVPQPVGAYLDYMIQSSREEELAEARVLTIDPGYFSVDWVQLAGFEIQPNSSGSSTNATSRVLEEAAKTIYENTGGRVAPERIERSLRDGKDTLYQLGDHLNLEPYLKQAAQRVSPTVIDGIQGSLRGSNDTVDLILLTGGGAAFYEDPIREAFPQSEVVRPRDPVASNARGFWWYAQSSNPEAA